MPDLVILAAGLGTRYGGLKQLAPVGPSGEALLHYAIYDATRAGFDRIVLVIRADLESAFRERVVEPLAAAVPIELVHQEHPARRRKPWGTGHALLSIRTVVDDPFATCNADDFYGAEAYRLMVDHLRRTPADGALIGYRLDDTLSDAGGVSRAICRIDDGGYLRRVVEVRDIARGDGGVEGVDLGGAQWTLEPAQPISTGFWGFPPSVLDALRRRFDAFRARRPGPTDEFLLSGAVDDMLARDELRVRVLPTSAPFLGVTRAADRAVVAAALRDLVAAGAYPGDVARALREGSV